MTTPPPSTTSNTTNDPGSSGVAPPDGYTTDTGQMSTSGRNISNAAEDAQGEVDDLQTTEVAAADFGKAHTEWHADYSTAMEQIGAGATAMCTNIMSFAGQLGGAGQSYESTDTGATSTVTTPGSGL
ncbi:WXG100 family type VII secretion target [Actinophytocola gossypii]|uniref:Excreted virulence factor EspC, type VII ESX diderm n=1 Tax=Actinophytocola gossypii TaxID=2812003 RepID=A0ABT2JI49_9PSEU|nr:WXG100 family type VII secretion target [Actinophytocola gossypii]MCT2587396.1 hypothetical protein [Actinophytocola gossypii]